MHPLCAPTWKSLIVIILILFCETLDPECTESDSQSDKAMKVSRLLTFTFQTSKYKVAVAGALFS